MWTLFLRRLRISATEDCRSAISLTKMGNWYEMLERVVQWLIKRRPYRSSRLPT